MFLGNFVKRLGQVMDVSAIKMKYYYYYYNTCGAKFSIASILWVVEYANFQEVIRVLLNFVFDFCKNSLAGCVINTGTVCFNNVRACPASRLTFLWQRCS